MKCPACGFDNDDAREWCDFCKEPFRKKSQAQAAARAPEGERRPSLTPELVRKLLDARGAPRESSGSSDFSEFSGLDPGERIPETPPVARWLAWGFLALCVLWMLIGAFWAVSKFG